MRIGLVTKLEADTVARLVRHGFRSVQIVVWPGDLLDARTGREREVRQLCEQLAAHDITISSLGCYDNHFDPARQPALREHFVGLLGRAADLGIGVVATFTGREPERSIEDNIPRFTHYWGELAVRAADLGVRIAFENCPKFRGHPFRGGNIAFTPAAWDLMFDALPTPTIGLEWDAAHLVCLLIDPVATIRRYGDRIYHVHAKDAEVRMDLVERYGILDERATRHRMVGLGQSCWSAIISALIEAGYTGALDIEGRHDPIYRDALEDEGLRIAHESLRRYVPQP